VPHSGSAGSYEVDLDKLKAGGSLPGWAALPTAGPYQGSGGRPAGGGGAGGGAGGGGSGGGADGGGVAASALHDYKAKARALRAREFELERSLRSLSKYSATAKISALDVVHSR
jgi:hypothetical protein